MKGHSITWDHTGCDHDEEDCSPQATFTCQAEPDSLCLNGCQECEDVWWLCGGGERCAQEREQQQDDLDEDDDPPAEHPTERHCTRGHLITPNWNNECYAVLNLNYGGNGPVSWGDAYDQFEGKRPMPAVDGPIVVINNGEDGCGWSYPAVTE